MAKKKDMKYCVEFHHLLSSTRQTKYSTATSLRKCLQKIQRAMKQSPGERTYDLYAVDEFGGRKMVQVWRDGEMDLLKKEIEKL